ncbi:sigma-70 family RNA polymerase sigma factor [Pseudenhygromyxa sp. WMMC2535]|uniref:RNA polymerase sigma factor n=1 Tax=Pseudenhygromyxa sp. WMMC2535 TaxID=2712867 RepID=UPI0015564EC8|nr:sigma-70 family RNA polymerase sigma factor [Pseudenhygromyxa sp. WMMC2535]NVB43192.1 sigma-70 family RNA polymerase sigma factor [Pseudenhygromyxa sp. WMMC2535]
MSARPQPRHHDAASLFRAHASFVASFLHRLGALPAEVDDLVQEVFLVAHRRGGFIDDGRARPTTWLAEIAIRVASVSRRSKRRSREQPDHAAINDARSHTVDPGTAVETEEALDRVQTALDTLDPERRAIFILFELEGEPCSAIAESFEIPIGTVYSRLHKARKQFKEAHARLLARERPAARPSVHEPPATVMP